MTSTTTSPPSLPAPRPCDGLVRAGWALVGVGAVLSLIALADADMRLRFAFAYLWAFVSVWTLCLGSLFFIAIHHLTHAIWSVAIRRAFEAFASFMPFLAILFLPILGFSLLLHPPLFPWMDPEAMAHNPLLEGKGAYLNTPFFLARLVLFFVIWIGFARFFIKNSLSQDTGDGKAETTARMRRFSPICVILFAFSITFAGIDWLMSLEPAWYSTIFGVYLFSGMTLTALAAVTLATLWLRRSGRLGQNTIHRDHLYTLGVLLFGFTCFWAYIAYSQYMLIWYAHMPEETFYLKQRLEGPWLGVSIALALMRFAIPFLVLLSQRAKSDPRILAWVSVLVLAGQLLDIYWLVMPQVHSDAPCVGLAEIAPLCLLAGIFLGALARFFGRHAPAPTGDPLFEASKNYHL